MTLRNVSAILTLLSGIVMCFLSFFVGGTHTVDGSVLMYFGQCLVYAGGIFSISGYAKRLISREVDKLRGERQCGLGEGEQ